MKKILFSLVLIFLSLTLQAKETTLFLNHPNWQHSYLLKNGRLYSEDRKNNADVLFYDEKTLVVKWDQYGTELFKKREIHFPWEILGKRRLKKSIKNWNILFKIPSF